VMRSLGVCPSPMIASSKNLDARLRLRAGVWLAEACQSVSSRSAAYHPAGDRRFRPRNA
jgi:hypothetical protein